MVDYLNRGESLQNMCLWEYHRKVYKEKIPEKKETEKDDEDASKRQVRYPFLNEHPQSETHWQIVRENNNHVPALSKLPSNPDTNEEKFQQCMLALFKPFTCYEDIYDGISWETSFESFYDAIQDTEFVNYIDNICELHKGIDEKKERLVDMQNDETAIVDQDPDSSDELDPNSVI
jgi:hypothetical protein